MRMQFGWFALEHEDSVGGEVRPLSQWLKVVCVGSCGFNANPLSIVGVAPRVKATVLPMLAEPLKRLRCAWVRAGP